jgi:hypothetical protein
VSGINVSAFYCHHHQAWSASTSSYRQDGDKAMTLVGQASMSFGPFDSEDEVRAWMLRAVLAIEDLLP